MSTGAPVPPAPQPLGHWQRHGRKVLRQLRNSLILYAVVGVIASAGSLFVGVPPSFDSSRVASAPNFDDDVAGSWNRFNAGDASTAPSWTVDQVKAAAGEVRGGDIVALPGSRSVIDEARVEQALAGTRYVVVLTPPTPLGASETTRLRDNTAQQRWADQQGISLVMVHGQQVVVPFGTLNERIIFSLPDAGIPQREAMRTGDVTDLVVRTIASAIDRTTAPADDPGTLDAAAVALTDTRAPTAAELSPVTEALDRGPLYVDPSIADPPRYDEAWADLTGGAAPKIVLLPFAKAGSSVDWTGALATRYPDVAILVMTGKWIESAGIDRDQVLAALWQTYAVGQYALASSAPAYGQILDWVTSVAGIARASAAQHSELPAAAPGGIPRWLSYLVLGTSLVIAAAFAVPLLWRRRSSRRPTRGTRGEWRDTVLTTMTTCYLQVSQAADLAFDDGVRSRTRAALDVAGANLQAVRSMPRDPMAQDDRLQQVAAARSAWFALDEAARTVGRPDLQPGVLSPGMRPEPADEPAVAPGRRLLSRGGLRPERRGLSRWAWLVIALVLGAVAYNIVSQLDRGVGNPAAAAPAALRTSNVAGLDGADRTAVEQAIGDRALMLVYSTAPTTESFRTARGAGTAYPNALVFVIPAGTVDGSAIGRAAAVPGYDYLQLIDDYYPVQFAGGTDQLAQARQLVLLYDRLTAEGSIRGAVRAAFDGPDRPWVLITVVVILALIAAALIIRFGVGAASRRLAAGSEERALRESLSLGLAGAQQDWLQHGVGGDPARAAGWAQRARELQQRIASADPEDVPALAGEIEALHAEISRG